MAREILDVAKLEETKLLSELERNPAFQRLGVVRQLIALYEADVPQDGGAIRPTFSVERSSTRATPRSVSLAVTIVGAAEKFLRERGSRAQTPVILKALREQGIAFTSVNPQGLLSSALSHNDLFDNKRGEGYGLVAWSNGPELPELKSAEVDPAPIRLAAEDPQA